MKDIILFIIDIILLIVYIFFCIKLTIKWYKNKYNKEEPK